LDTTVVFTYSEGEDDGVFRATTRGPSGIVVGRSNGALIRQRTDGPIHDWLRQSNVRRYRGRLPASAPAPQYRVSRDTRIP